MPHFLQGIKLTHRMPWGNERSVNAHIAWAFKRLGLKDRLDENRWLNPRRRVFAPKRVYRGQFS